MAAAGGKIQNKFRDWFITTLGGLSSFLRKLTSSPLLLLITVSLNPPSRSLQDGDAAGEVELSPPITPSSRSCGEKAGQGGCLSPLPGCEMVLQAGIRVMNLHGCHPETIIDSCFNDYFGKDCCRISKESPGPFYKFKYIFLKSVFQSIDCGECL